MSTTTPSSTPANKRRLAGIGFHDLTGSQRWLQARELAEVNQDALLDGLRHSPSPDTALKSIVRILATNPGFSRLVDRGEQAAPAYRLLGASEALGEFLSRRPQHLSLLEEDPQELIRAVEDGQQERFRAALLTAVGADPEAAQPIAETTGQAAKEAVRVAYREHLTRIALADLSADDPTAFLPKVAAALADLAGAALEAALAVARAEVGAAARPVSLSIIGMGKCGARELNYISDVDVVYAVGPAPAEGAGNADADAAEAGDADGKPTDADAADAPDEQTLIRVGTELVKALTRVIHGMGPEPGLWEVDANLRPEGKDGPLVRTIDSHRTYYARWAENWEFQALLKARPIAGGPHLGREYLDAVTDVIWEASSRDGFVASVQAMRRRVTDNIPEEEAERQIKLGAGGLRDVEFTVQLLQLVHGRTDPNVRARSTTEALEQLSERTYIGRADAARFSEDYRWLRLLEHRIQLLHLRRTHLMPVKEHELSAVARGLLGPDDAARPTPEKLAQQWRSTKRSVRGLHERLFFRPLLAAVAHLSADEVALSTDAARDRLAALGYLDPKAAMRHIEALTRGLSRRAEIQRTILPVLLGWFAEGVDPDAGLLGFRRVSEALGQTHWYLKMLRDSPAAAERLCALLSSSRYITDMLEDEPESIAWLDRDEHLRPQSFDALWQEIQAKVARHAEAEAAVRMIRLIRRREILRVALGEATGVLEQDEVMRGLSDIDQATILGALRAAEQEAYSGQREARANDGADQEATGPREPLTDVAVIGMGRQGGAEIGYGSDADVLFVHQPREGADEQQALAEAEGLVSRMTSLLTSPARPAIRAERTLGIDADLRPEGRSGPMVRSLDSYAEYYARWADTWEHQALLRARPLAGSDDVAQRFLRIIDQHRYPADFPEAKVREIRRMKARVEAERMPRGADPHRQVKLGRGGLSDVEWLAQLIQLQHAHAHPELRTTSTLRVLREAANLEIIDSQNAQTLETAWRLATRVRGGNLLRTGRASDSLPTQRQDLEAIARWAGYGPNSARELEEDYLRATRRARTVYEKLFYGHLD